MQTIEGQWVKLQELRDLLYATAHDRVLADWVLGRLANTTFADGYVVYKYVSRQPLGIAVRSGIWECACVTQLFASRTS